jgi:phage-related protein
MFTVVFFAKPSGHEPARDFLRGLDREDRLVVGTDLATVQYGFPIGMPVCRPLGDGLYEVRSTLPSRREARLLFFQEGRDLIVVSGFIKKAQATPAAELRTARERRRNYLAMRDR